jgi:hypothetical protein
MYRPSHFLWITFQDDGKHHEPTKKLIMDALERLCEMSEPGDSIFFQFSGTYIKRHSSKVSIYECVSLILILLCGVLLGDPLSYPIHRSWWPNDRSEW